VNAAGNAMKTTVRLTRKGQITVPRQVRETLGLHAGDEIELSVEDGKIVIRPVRRYSVDELLKLLPGSPTSYPGEVAEKAAIVQELARKEHRIRDR